jgi:hypothetical protein
VATYVPELAGSEYGKTPIRALLHMSSGVAFSETYDGQDDIARLASDLFGRPAKTAAASVAQFNTRTAPPGTVWHYASIETEILGLVLRAAIGKPVADYLREKIWQPIGTEADASWAIDGTGQEVTFCCFNAVLRDYARLGRLHAHDGAWDGRQLIPRQWLIDTTTLRLGDAYLAPGAATPYYGYGFQLWLLPGTQRQFALLGIRGQAIFVDPAAKLVMVHTAVRRKPVDPGNAEAVALWSGVVQRLGVERRRPGDGKAGSPLRRRRRIDEAGHRFETAVIGDDGEIRAGEIEGGLRRASRRPTKAQVAVMRLDAAHQTQPIFRELRLGGRNHRVDAVVTDAATMGVDVGSVRRPRLGNEIAAPLGVPLVPSSDVAHDELVDIADHRRRPGPIGNRRSRAKRHRSGAGKRQRRRSQKLSSVHDRLPARSRRAHPGSAAQRCGAGAPSTNPITALRRPSSATTAKSVPAR